MKQINNNFDSCYYLTRKGEVYNCITDKYIKADSCRSFKLKTIEGNTRKISLKKLYKLVFNENYCVDNIENLQNEEWKPIERTDNKYWISDKGRVKSYSHYEAIILKPNITKGYERIDIFQEGSRSSKLISRLVAAAFLLPPASIDMELHHINNCKRDNRKENLIWLTPAEHKKIHKQMKNMENGVETLKK